MVQMMRNIQDDNNMKEQYIQSMEVLYIKNAADTVIVIEFDEYSLRQYLL